MQHIFQPVDSYLSISHKVLPGRSICCLSSHFYVLLGISNSNNWWAVIKDGLGGHKSLCLWWVSRCYTVSCAWGIWLSTEQNRFGPRPQDLTAQPVFLQFPLLVRSLLFNILHFKKDDIENSGKKRIKKWRIGWIRKRSEVSEDLLRTIKMYVL